MSATARQGDRFVVATAFEARLLLRRESTFADGGLHRLPEGFAFTVTFDPPDAATAIAADIEPEAEVAMVEDAVRGDATYDGCSLVVPFDDLGRCCRRA